MRLKIPTPSSVGSGCLMLGEHNGSEMPQKENYLVILIGKSNEYVEPIADLSKVAVL
jgi:hypothetical protein